MVTNCHYRCRRENAPGRTGGQEVAGSNPASPTRKSLVDGDEASVTRERYTRELRENRSVLTEILTEVQCQHNQKVVRRPSGPVVIQGLARQGRAYRQAGVDHASRIRDGKRSCQGSTRAHRQARRWTREAGRGRARVARSVPGRARRRPAAIAQDATRPPRLRADLRVGYSTSDRIRRPPLRWAGAHREARDTLRAGPSSGRRATPRRGMSAAGARCSPRISQSSRTRN